MNPAASEGTPPRRISVYTYICKHCTAPPCLGEALRRGTLLKLHDLMIFRVWVRTIPFMPVLTKPIFSWFKSMQVLIITLEPFREESHNRNCRVN